jgi:putative transposase
MHIQIPTEKPYHTDHSIKYSCQYHVIFCPKYRRKVLLPPLDGRLKELFLEKQEAYDYSVMAIEIMPDHIHLLLDVDPRIGIVSIVGKIKGHTSHIIRKAFPWMKKRLPSLWTRGKFIASVGSVTLAVVQRYIDSQKGV